MVPLAPARPAPNRPRRRAALRRLLGALLLPAALPTALQAAGPVDTGLLDAQRKAMTPLAVLDGTWRGEAVVLQPDGTRLKLTQTERVGPMLDGTLRVIEGRGFRADGSLAFNAFAVISFSPRSGRYTFRSYAMGYVGDYPLELRPDGFVWSITLPDGVQLRYTITVKDDRWIEVGERIAPGQPPVKTLEMSLKRIGGTDWPAGGAVGP